MSTNPRSPQAMTFTDYQHESRATAVYPSECAVMYCTASMRVCAPIHPTVCNSMPFHPPSHLFTAGNIQYSSFQDNCDKGEGIWFTTPVVEGHPPIDIGSHILVTFNEGLVEFYDSKPRSFLVRSIALIPEGMQVINALPAPERADT